MSKALQKKPLTDRKFVHQLTWIRTISSTFGGYDGVERETVSYAIKGLVLPIKNQSNTESEILRQGVLVQPEGKVYFNRIDLESAGLFDSTNQLLINDADTFIFNGVEYECLGIVGVAPDIIEASRYVLYQVYFRKKILNQGEKPL